MAQGAIKISAGQTINLVPSWGRRLHQLKAAIIGEPLTPRLQAEHKELLLKQAFYCSFMGGVIYIFTILTYNYFYFPHILLRSLIACVPPAIAAFILPFTLKTNFIQKYYNLPMFLILGVFSNYAEVVNLQLTGGGEGPFFFPYFLIFFAMAVYYPGAISWVVATALLIIFTYITSEWIVGRDLFSQQVIRNIIYLIDAAALGILGNRIFYKFFIRDKKNQIELEEANQKLQELDKAKTRLFSNVTHEFRTPLVALSSTIQMMMDQSLKDPDLQRKLLSNSKECLEDMLENINDLLLKARSEKGLVEMKWSMLEIGEFAERSLQVFDIVAQKRNNRLVFTNKLPGPLRLYADRSKLKKIINNLIGNALKFTQNGTIEVILSQTDKHCVLQVKDTGKGIPKEDLQTIFEPFTQASNNPMREVQGTGLGLSMVKDFVGLHQGKVMVESEVGKGSLFTVYLLLGENHVDKNKIVLSDFTEEDQNIDLGVKSFEELDLTLFLKHDPQKQHILLVEDNPQIIQILAHVLADGYNLHFAKDGEEGLEKVREIQPDLVISDVMMPRKNGYELLAAIKNDIELRRIPCILLTSKADLESKLQGLEEGADEYLSKPFNHFEIRTRIKNIIERKRMEMEYIHAEKMIALGQVTAGISHEILNPIGHAKKAVDGMPALLTTIKKLSPSRELEIRNLEGAVKNAEDGIRRACDIALALTGFIRGSHGFQQCDLHDGIESTLKIFHINHRASVEIHRQYDLKEKVYCKLNQLNQVFLNLLNNAAQVLQNQAEGNIWIKTAQKDDYALITISDDGPGISKAIQARIFDPFFTTKGVKGGMGLGLYISQQIVQSHHGELYVESIPGKGTQFTIQIPLQQKRGGVDESIYHSIERRLEKIQYPHHG